MVTLISTAAAKYQAQRVAHWDGLAEHFTYAGLRSYYHRRVCKLYREIVPEGERVLEIGSAGGDLLAALAPVRGVGIDFSERMVAKARKNYPALEFIHGDAHNLGGITGPFDYIIFSDLIDDLWDVQCFFDEVRRLCTPSTRVVFNTYSHLWSLPLKAAQSFGIANPLLPQNWLSPDDVRGVLKLTGFTPVSHRAEILFPVYLPLITGLCNRLLVKFKPFSWFALTNFMVAAPAPMKVRDDVMPTVSVIVPARNEAGNIKEIVERVPQMGGGTELIFVEGGSADNTEDVIRKILAEKPQVNGALYKQAGTGKGDAVRLGFAHASGDILMILDADLTVAPEGLPKFYKALVNGHGEFINGVRLIYPMEGEAMRPFNLLGNKFFSFTFSWLLGQRIKDTLCGTKALWRSSYCHMAMQRNYFGEHDPFGDFDLLLGAVRLNLKIVDLPVRYGARSYGETNIQRWSHGLLLLRMLVVAAKKLKFI